MPTPAGFYVVTLLLYLVAIALYLASATSLWRGLSPAVAAAPAPPPHGAAMWLAVPALLLHGILLADVTFEGPGLHFGFAHALSATFWIAAAAVWFESFLLPLEGLLVLVLVAAAVTIVLPAVFSGTEIVVGGSNTLALRLHLSAAILAYSLLTIAALHAMLMASIDRMLHAGGVADGLGGRLMARIPPLLALETLLFRLIAAGFVFLTLTLVTGMVFSEELFGQAARFGHKDDYKTDFAITSWLVFAALLAGRRVFGWRGRTALRWTLSGFAFLLLAYVGSRFVLEVVLRRYA
ncbi:MAG TPA: cytochrome c biogenesis protein CcsA [Burkholderiaceae bacterium]|nr:cytochrome c biogenesis protein CcsA [Burkholderiaceae bacterium]